MSNRPQTFLPHPPRPERRDMRCTSCGATFIGYPGSCPKCASKSSVKTSNDEMTKKIVEDNDIFKGGL